MEKRKSGNEFADLAFLVFLAILAGVVFLYENLYEAVRASH